jgi:hypothetical protein
MDVYGIERKLETICAESIYYLIDNHPQLRYSDLHALTQNMVAFSIIHIYPWKYRRPPLVEEYEKKSKKFIDTWCTYTECSCSSKTILIDNIKKEVKETFVRYLLLK